MSTVRRTVVVLGALSALALTACGPTEDGAAGGTDVPPATPTATASPSTPPKPSAPAESATPPKPSATAKPPKPGPPSTDPDDVFPCSTYDLTFKATPAEPTTSSYLLKVTNKTGKPCRVLGHPVVTFGSLDGQAKKRGSAPGIEEAIRLAPGQSAYAGLMGGLKGSTSHMVSSVSLTMDTESDLTQVPLKASTPGLNVAFDNSVTAWMDNAEDALSL
ncbi:MULTISPECIES: DUF4232 domain-containing protein [unclassified Streptomyces]|uniref:DUF4232 domain-containing protein n=1 Tax=unclassified Streptomyces TaxID=2593676 RepID=UPI0036CD1D55